MIEDFKNYVSSLPEALSREQQDMLFYEMAKLKKEYAETGNVFTSEKIKSVRDKLIIHNLRLCIYFAFNYCDKHNGLKDIEDIYGDSVIALTRAIDDFDIKQGTSFSTFACKYMDDRQYKKYVKFQYDALSMSEGAQILDKDDNDIDEGVFKFLYDESEGNLTQDVAGNEFVVDIINYIENIENKRNSDVLKMYMGIGVDRQYVQQEIADFYGISRSLVAKILISEKEKLKQYIAHKYSLSLPDLKKYVINKKLNFDRTKEAYDYIFNSYYGLNGIKKKTTKELASELSYSEEYIQQIINKKKKGLSEEDKIKLSTDKKEEEKRKTRERWQSIFEDYYGLNVHKRLSRSEIVEKYGISKKTLNNIVLRQRNKNCIDEEKKMLTRNIRGLNKNPDENARIYFASRGLNGYAKKTYLEISKETGFSRSMIYSRIRKYQEYLDSLTPEERDKILDKDSSPEQAD